MHLTNEKEVKRFVKLLNDANQLLKTVKSTTDYSIVKGKFICSPNSDNGDLGMLRFDLIDTGKKDNVSEYLDNLTGSVIGLDLYTFLSNNKKEINEIEINKTNFVIKTSKGEEYRSNDVSNKDFNYKNFTEFITDKQFKGKKFLASSELSDDTKEEFNKISFPSLNIDGYELRITPKLFLKINNSVNITVNIYEYNKELNMIEIITDNPKLYYCKQYFLYIK